MVRLGLPDADRLLCSAPHQALSGHQRSPHAGRANVHSHIIDLCHEGRACRRERDPGTDYQINYYQHSIKCFKTGESKHGHKHMLLNLFCVQWNHRLMSYSAAAAKVKRTIIDSQCT